MTDRIEADHSTPDLHLVADEEVALSTDEPRVDPDVLRARLRHHMEREGLSQRALARELDTTHRALARWIEGEPETKAPEIEEAVAALLASVRRPDEWLPTPTSEAIVATLAHAQAAGDLAVVFGAPGTGKTTTLRHYAATYEHVWVATITPSTATVVPALEEIAEAVGVRDISGGARRLARAIRARVRDLGGLIILDEAQHLRLEALEEIRAIHDATGCAIALVGNEIVYARMTGGNRQAHHAQLFSRMGVRYYVPGPSAADVRALAKQWGCRDKEAMKLLQRVAKRPGALRIIVKILRLAAAEGKRLDADSIRAAIADLGAEEL